MVRNAADFAERNTERAVHATNYGMSWLREIAEQNLNQSKAAAEIWLSVTRKAVDALDQQASTIRERSMVVAEATLSNTFDILHKVARMKDPHELAQIQSEFVSRQARVLGDQTKEFGQTIMQGAGEVTKTVLARAEEDSQPTRGGIRGQAPNHGDTNASKTAQQTRDFESHRQ